MACTRRDLLRSAITATALGATHGWATHGWAARAGAAPPDSTGGGPTRSPRVADFERMAYGMFVHWGLFSHLGRCVWGVHPRRFPADEYQKLPAQFAADEFDARRWAATARQAGMKYITLTTRQHDGFSLYDTRGLCDYDAPHSAAARDLVAEFVEGCRAEGIVPFFYHTTYDWYQKSFTEDFDAYLDYLHKSVELLCTHYGPVGGFWFDGNWSRTDADWKEDRLYGIIRKLQPEAVIINNTGVDRPGALGHPEIDCVTFEQGRPTDIQRTGAGKHVAGEMCQTLNMHWGYAPLDFDYLSPSGVIQYLCACRRAGANYLLNVGPTPGGRIPEYETAVLARAGQWVQLHAEPIYHGKPCDVQAGQDDFCLEADGRLYWFAQHLAVRPGEPAPVGATGPGPRQLANIQRPVESVRWLDNQEQLAFEQKSNGELIIQATAYPPGTNLVVRVARLD